MGGDAAFNVASGRSDNLMKTIVPRARTQLDVGARQIELGGMAASQHDVGDDPRLTMRFASGGDVVDVIGFGRSGDSLRLETGVDLPLAEQSGPVAVTIGPAIRRRARHLQQRALPPFAQIINPRGP
ncbi:autotransporter domain-containing protein [Salibaculum halophilum]|uniref:autotransporter domain-containing protein n=1 Tax=Salibaculum halophilum TaxID=1914408 RepID=UPI0015C43804|nr:autotransporter domain-containing protein [Salibaculum halophilum]